MSVPHFMANHPMVENLNKLKCVSGEIKYYVNNKRYKSAVFIPALQAREKAKIKFNRGTGLCLSLHFQTKQQIAESVYRMTGL